MSKTLTIAITCFYLFLTASSISATVIHVPSEQPTIQAGVDAFLTQGVEMPGFCDVMVWRPDGRFHGGAHQLLGYGRLQEQFDRTSPSQDFGKVAQLLCFETRRGVFQETYSLASLYRRPR